MNRRVHMKTLVTAGLGGALPLSLYAAEAKPLDRFGGWTGKPFEATGFFRVEKDERWWLVTPEGNAFLGVGINHLYPDLFRQPYTKKTWQTKLGIENLFDPSQFGPALRTWFLRSCRDYGFNTVGVHNALSIVNRPAPALPYVQPIKFVDIPHWKTEVPDENFLDVFAPAFAERCDRLARETAAPRKDDPFLLGYSMTDCPLFTEEDCRERPREKGLCENHHSSDRSSSAGTTAASSTLPNRIPANVLANIPACSTTTANPMWSSRKS